MKVRSRVCWETHSSSKSEHAEEHGQEPINEIPVFIGLSFALILLQTILDTNCDTWLSGAQLTEIIPTF